jgi:hypothetical protein
MNEELAELPFEARLLFQGLWMLADIEGRLQDRPMRIKAEVFPYDDLDVGRLLGALHAKRLITRYEVDGGKFIQVNKFKEHQRITGKEAETVSTIPEVPREALEINREAAGKQWGNNGETPETTGREGKGKEGKGREGNGGSSLASLREATEPAVLTFPCNGTPQTWDLTQTRIDEWKKLYPGLDILAECRKALAWVEANGRKTASGMRRYFGLCLKRISGRFRPAPAGFVKPTLAEPDASRSAAWREEGV